MINLSEVEIELEKFGLSKNQASIYLTLVQHKALRIGELVSATRIPRSSVYENLKALFELGLIEETIEDTYKKIKAYPIGNLRHRLTEKLNEFHKQIEDLKELERTFSLIPRHNSVFSTTVRHYKNISGARQLFWNSLKAKSVVYVYSAYGRSNFVGKKFYIDFVGESTQRSIKERVLVNPTPRFFILLKRDLDSPLARTKLNDLRTLDEEKINIKGETFIYDNIYAQVYLDTKGISGFEIESREFVKTQRSIFETLWDWGKPITKADL